MRNLSVFLFILLFALSADALGPGDDQCQAESNKPAPAPSGQLEGSNNYWMVALDTSTGKCTRLHSPSVTIKVHSDMSVDQNGFDFQFNVNVPASATYPDGTDASGKGPGLAEFQQYIVNVYSSQDGNPNRTDIFGMVNNWPTTPPGMSTTHPGPCWKNYPASGNCHPVPPNSYPNCDQCSDLVNTRSTKEIFYLATLTNTPIPTLPDGTVVTITLDTDPKNGESVTGVTFKVDLPSSATTVVDPNYTYYNGQKISLIDFQHVGIPLDPSICQGNPPDSRYCPAGFVYNPNNPVSPGNVTVADTSPVMSFALNIAGDQMVSSGAGTITYAVSNGILVPVSGPPQDCATQAGTVETSYYTYSTLQACTTGPLVQSFNSQYCGTMPTNPGDQSTLVCSGSSPECVAGQISYQYIGPNCPAHTVPQPTNSGWKCSSSLPPSCNVRCVTSYKCVPSSECRPPSTGCSPP
jgi:hypothetical protein